MDPAAQIGESKASALVSSVGHGEFHGRDQIKLMGHWSVVSGVYCMRSHVVSPTLIDAFVLLGCLCYTYDTGTNWFH